jgi:hypothetical protein
MKTQRQKKADLRKKLIKIYDLPNLVCKRWGIGKAPTRTDILKGMLWNVFRQFIIKRDTKNGKGVCISCGVVKLVEELQAGHYAPVGGGSISLDFREENVNGECAGCNGFDPFHLVPMRKNMVKKWGEDTVMDLDIEKGMHKTTKWTELDFVQRIKHYYELI